MERAELAVDKFEATFVLLQAVAELGRGGYISAAQKAHLKNLIVCGEPALVDAGLRYLETNEDRYFYATLVGVATADHEA